MSTETDSKQNSLRYYQSSLAAMNFSVDNATKYLDQIPELVACEHKFTGRDFHDVRSIEYCKKKGILTPNHLMEIICENLFSYFRDKYDTPRTNLMYLLLIDSSVNVQLNPLYQASPEMLINYCADQLINEYPEFLKNNYVNIAIHDNYYNGGKYNDVISKLSIAAINAGANPLESGDFLLYIMDTLNLEMFNYLFEHYSTDSVVDAFRKIPTNISNDRVKEWFSNQNTDMFMYEMNTHSRLRNSVLAARLFYMLGKLFELGLTTTMIDNNGNNFLRLFELYGFRDEYGNVFDKYNLPEPTGGRLPVYEEKNPDNTLLRMIHLNRYKKNNSLEIQLINELNAHPEYDEATLRDITWEAQHYHFEELRRIANNKYHDKNLRRKYSSITPLEIRIPEHINYSWPVRFD